MFKNLLFRFKSLQRATFTFFPSVLFSQLSSPLAKTTIFLAIGPEWVHSKYIYSKGMAWLKEFRSTGWHWSLVKFHGREEPDAGL